ncbi:hypothetical protein [Undibacterium sp.]|jgi:hypothetical protein|uniref:hypothetical protein n=1 Tax=Undibacterium sp. TaxID=1914977 RepID=UPI002CE35FED|nr:hypothetical protein [Undibacterium sp.]HTD06944.1 hypothetical protein [Undibacterium sp.]
MDLLTEILLGVFGGVIACNLYACFRVATSDSFERKQKYMQFILIWLVPVVGAAVVYVFTRESKSSDVRRYRSGSALFGVEDISNGAGDYFGDGHFGD